MSKPHIRPLMFDGKPAWECFSLPRKLPLEVGFGYTAEAAYANWKIRRDLAPIADWYFGISVFRSEPAK